MSTRSRVVHLQPAARAARSNATWWQIYRGRLQSVIGRLMQRFRVPGFVRDIEFHDAATGYDVSVATGELFTRITLNGRDFYFRRSDGRYDGSGSTCGWNRGGEPPTPTPRHGLQA